MNNVIHSSRMPTILLAVFTDETFSQRNIPQSRAEGLPCKTDSHSTGQEILSFYKSRWFITVFRKACHCAILQLDKSRPAVTELTTCNRIPENLTVVQLLKKYHFLFCNLCPQVTNTRTVSHNFKTNSQSQHGGVKRIQSSSVSAEPLYNGSKSTI